MTVDSRDFPTKVAQLLQYPVSLLRHCAEGYGGKWRHGILHEYNAKYRGQCYLHHPYVDLLQLNYPDIRAIITLLFMTDYEVHLQLVLTVGYGNQ